MTGPAVPGIPPVLVAFPPGLEHLDSSKLPEGFIDKGNYALYTTPIVKSDNDANVYALIRLPNGLEAMIVHDPAADQPAASLSVRVGHYSDPDDLPGLAHALEHLMFQGTAKYPSENEYNAYLSGQGGWSNAFTATNETRYFFQVANEGGFPEALDRFAQFFVHPLFREDCVERELQAVNSEHEKNLSNDGWRVMQLARSLSKPSHPNHKFGTGNLETLWHGPKARGIDVRAEIIAFYHQQ